MVIKKREKKMDDSHWEGKKCEAFYARGEVSLLQQNNSRGVFLNYFDTKWYLFIRKILDVLFLARDLAKALNMLFLISLVQIFHFFHILQILNHQSTCP